MLPVSEHKKTRCDFHLNFLNLLRYLEYSKKYKDHQLISLHHRENVCTVGFYY